MSLFLFHKNLSNYTYNKNKLNTNYCKPLKYSREHFVINNVTIKEVYLRWDGILGSISVNDTLFLLCFTILH